MSKKLTSLEVSEHNLASLVQIFELLNNWEIEEDINLETSDRGCSIKEEKQK